MRSVPGRFAVRSAGRTGRFGPLVEDFADLSPVAGSHGQVAVRDDPDQPLVPVESGGIASSGQLASRRSRG